MAFFTTTDINPSWIALPAASLAKLGAWLEAFAEKHSRRDQIAFFNSLTDAQLAARGIRRDQIAHHVFRDKMYI